MIEYQIQYSPLYFGVHVSWYLSRRWVKLNCRGTQEWQNTYPPRHISLCAQLDILLSTAPLAFTEAHIPMVRPRSRSRLLMRSVWKEIVSKVWNLEFEANYKVKISVLKIETFRLLKHPWKLWLSYEWPGNVSLVVDRAGSHHTKTNLNNR